MPTQQLYIKRGPGLHRLTVSLTAYDEVEHHSLQVKFTLFDSTEVFAVVKKMEWLNVTRTDWTLKIEIRRILKSKLGLDSGLVSIVAVIGFYSTQTLKGGSLEVDADSWPSWDFSE